MASNFEVSINRGSDLFFDFSCFTCQENDINREAEFYCDKCSKFFCGECVEYHNFLYKKHVTLGKENISNWPVSNASLDIFEQCQEHKKELTAYCEGHSELLCHLCHIYKHQKCSHVLVLADKAKALQQNGEFKKFSATVDTLHEQLLQRNSDLKERMKSLENNYNKILEEINNLRKAINASLDQLEKNTIKELATLLATMITPIQTDIDQCTESIKMMSCVQEDWHNITDKSETIHLIMYRKCLDQSVKTEEVLKEMKAKKEVTLTFNPATSIQQTLSTLSGLGQILHNEKQSQTVGSTTTHTDTRPSKAKEHDPLSLQSDTGNQASTSHCSGLSRNLHPGNQASTINKADLVSNAVSSSLSQPQSGNQTSAEKKSDKMSNKISSSTSKPIPEIQTKDVKKKNLVSYPVFSLSHPANQTNAVNTSTIVSNPVSRLSSQAEPKKQTSAVNKPYQVTDPNNVIKLEKSKMFKVRLTSDSSTCWISGISETATGLLITDRNNNNVKLLDQTYKVVAKCDLPSSPMNICSIDSSLVAVVVHRRGVHFIRVTNGQLVQERTMKPQHICMCIAHHQGNLYISSGSALYQYTLDGTLVCKINEDISSYNTVTSFAISQGGDRIYVVNQYSNKLLTLSRDGKHMSTLADISLNWGFVFGINCLHVTDLGQVLLCNIDLNTVLQVDKDGTQILAKVITGMIGKPASVYCSKNTGALVVGMWNNDNIMVYTQ